MINERGIKSKWLLLLVAMAFGWISVGSLILFHKEHVLRQHVDLQHYLFIAPKTKDKAGISLKQANFKVTSFSTGGFDAVSCNFDQVYYGLNGPIAFIQSPSTPAGITHFFSLQGLRAPPQA